MEGRKERKGRKEGSMEGTTETSKRWREDERKEGRKERYYALDQLFGSDLHLLSDNSVNHQR